jgi:hypothetical protein
MHSCTTAAAREPAPKLDSGRFERNAGELAALSQQLVVWLVDSPPSPHAPPRLASPSYAANEENAALRKAIEDADYECGVGLLRLNQLDLVTLAASPATVRRSKRNCAFTRSNSSRNLDFLHALASPLQVAKRSNCAFSTVRGQRLSPAVDNDSLEVTTSTRSRERGACKGTAGAHAMRARRLDAVVDLERHRVALLNKNSRHGSTMCIRTTAHTYYCQRRYTI